MVRSPAHGSRRKRNGGEISQERSLIGTGVRAILDLFFPPLCINCGKYLESHDPFCPECAAQIRFIEPPYCITCGAPFLSGEREGRLCGECLTSQNALSQSRSLGAYETVLLEAIHKFKYGGKVSYGRALGKLMARFSFEPLRIGDYDLIVPVPLFPGRLKQRGFNQALVLAREISRAHSIPLDYESLARTRDTGSQMSLGRKERRTNVRGAFNVRNQDGIRGKSILLVDDVYTTGSTLKECAQALLDHGAGKVAALTIARAL